MSTQDPSAHRPAAPDDSPEPEPESVLRYRERLTVAWWMWLVVLFVGAASFVALAPINIPVGVLAAVVAMVVLSLVLYLGSPEIVLTDRDLRVGRAHIERRFVGTAEALTGQAARQARGPELDGRAFMNFRISVDGLCRIQIVDPVDPTPYWLTATRHPQALARAVNEGGR